jgi:hypothetical protein
MTVNTGHDGPRTSGDRRRGPVMLSQFHFFGGPIMCNDIGEQPHRDVHVNTAERMVHSQPQTTFSSGEDRFSVVYY